MFDAGFPLLHICRRIVISPSRIRRFASSARRGSQASLPPATLPTVGLDLVEGQRRWAHNSCAGRLSHCGPVARTLLAIEMVGEFDPQCILRTPYNPAGSTVTNRRAQSELIRDGAAPNAGLRRRSSQARSI
jgi:hypothetical protein